MKRERLMWWSDVVGVKVWRMERGGPPVSEILVAASREGRGREVASGKIRSSIETSIREGNAAESKLGETGVSCLLDTGRKRRN